MATREEAREHIKLFRARRGIAENDFNIEGNINLRDISQSLKILSDQLYGDLNHFIWELLQNADDSKYPDNTPARVDFILSDRTLTFQTNETGFTKDDVESLCAIGYSTKAGQNDTIGEKGIGFKSVFGIADVVSIHSGVYSFEFDTRPPLGNLGMVLPVWLENAQEFRGTSIIMQLKHGVDRASLRSQLLAFDFSFLLFSRKIKILNVQVHHMETLGKLVKLGPTSWGIEKLINGVLIEVKEYVTYHAIVRAMPRRLGVQGQPSRTESTISLAFPHRNQQPHLEPQKTYAFLPMDHFGFQFLIHADFVLIANRRDVQHGVEWNERLRTGLSETLCLAFEWLATSRESSMRHTWPEYLECLRSIPHRFLGYAASTALAALRSRPLVETGSLETYFSAPQNSFSASPAFRQTSGELLIRSGDLARLVISTAYSANSTRNLENLGVTPFTISHFVTQLHDYIRDEFTGFSSNTSEWHSRVAALLLQPLSIYTPRHPSGEVFTIRALRIIPLNDGSWVSGDSSQDGTIFLDEDQRSALPAGLNFRFVQRTATADRNRRRLYELLGAKPCDENQICGMIVKSHETINQPRSLPEYISHAVYLFRAHYWPGYGSRVRLCLVDSNLFSRNHGIMCIPFGEVGSGVRRLFADDFNGIVWLHPQYENSVTNNERKAWLDFLSSLEGVTTLPPLESGGMLSDAMKHILARNGSMEFLGHLRMRHFGRLGYVPSLASSNFYSHSARASIGDIPVTTDRGIRRLCETALPSLSSVSMGLLPLLQLNEPDHPDWSFLHEFGVLTMASPELFISQIRSLKAISDQGRTNEIAKAIYSAMSTYQGLTSSHLHGFESERLIYVHPGRWLLPIECIWRASFPCTIVPVLSRIYRGCRTLFQSLLRVRDAGLDDLILELGGIDSRDEVDRADVLRQEMLPALDSFLNKSSLSESQRRSLLSARIFPVTQTELNTPALVTRFCRGDDKFWIADMNYLKLKFEGVLPLLDITGGLFKSSIDNVFQKLSMDHKKLSNTVQREQIHQGNSQMLDHTLTGRLQRQSQYIIAIVSHNRCDGSSIEELKAKLRSVQVSRVQDITVRWFVLDGLAKTFGHDDQGEVHFVDLGMQLQINIRQDLGITDIIVPLTERFSEYLHLGDTHRELLSKVLTTEKVDQFMERLERAGVQVTQTMVAENEAEVSVEDEFDDATLFEASNNSLESAFGQLQLGEGRRSSVAGNHSSILRQMEPPATPSGQLLQQRIPMIDSAISMRTREILTPIRRIWPAATTVARPVAEIGSMERLVTRLTHATLFDSTSDVLRRGLRTPDFAETGTSGVSQPLLLGSGIQYEVRSESTFGRNASSHGIDVNVPDPARASPSTGRAITSVASLRSNADLMTPWPSLNLNFELGAPRRDGQQSNGNLAPEGTPGSSNSNQFIARDQFADTPAEIGFVGEYLVYKFFEEKLSPSFTHRNWTSNNRNRVFQERFGNGLRERDFADFTYADINGNMGQYLREIIPGFELALGQSNVTYHLEVKTTLEGISTPALLSNNQISMAKRRSKRLLSSDTQTNVYILVRVYDLALDPPRPQFCLFPDPWDLICKDLLQIAGDKGIYVQPRILEATHQAQSTIMRDLVSYINDP